MSDVTNLTDVQVVEALSNLADHWLEHRGREAYSMMQRTYATASIEGISLPAWAEGRPSTDPHAAQAARQALDLVLHGPDPEAQRWASRAIKQATGGPGAEAAVSSIVVGGAMLIGLVLAARIGKVDVSQGKIEFFEGLPKELAELLGKAAGFALS